MQAAEKRQSLDGQITAIMRQVQLDEGDLDTVQAELDQVRTALQALKMKYAKYKGSIDTVSGVLKELRCDQVDSVQQL